MKSWCAIIVLLFYQFSCIIGVGWKVEGDQKGFILDKFDNRCAGPNPALTWNCLGVRKEGNKMFGNGTVDVKTDIPTDPGLSLKIDRCRNKENLDTCEYFYHTKYDSFCKIVDFSLFTVAFRQLQPPFRCPMKKALYRATNVELDLSTLLFLPTQRWYWIMQWRTFEKATNRTFSCYTCGFYFTPN